MRPGTAKPLAAVVALLLSACAEDLEPSSTDQGAGLGGDVRAQTTVEGKPADTVLGSDAAPEDLARAMNGVQGAGDD